MNELEKLQIENLELKSMCMAAALEIRDQWEAHCDNDGYGPCNLVSRLEGALKPTLYPNGLTEEEVKYYIEKKYKTNEQPNSI